MFELEHNPRPKRAPLARSQWADLLAYEYPTLLKKLLLQKIVSSREEGQSLFTELKRYLILIDHDRTRAYPMISRRVDEVWHQFVLFTVEYTRFCERFFGRYLHHHPGNAPHMDLLLGGRAEATRDELVRSYAALFGLEMPAIWYDALAITLARRVVRSEQPGPFSVKIEAGKASLVMTPHDGSAPRILANVDAWGAPGLDVIALREAFFVRELPAPLAPEDKIALVAALVDSGTLRIAP